MMYHMCSQTDQLRIFIMDCGITRQNREKLLRQAARFDNVEIIFHNIEKKLDEVVPKVPTKWHRAIYGRLFLDDIVKRYDGVDRLLYLDCDTLMNAPVTELFTMDMQGKCMAAVIDADNDARKKALEIPEEYSYINSGVLLIDTEKWLALDASRRIIECINHFPELLLYPDQDAINYILYRDILTLPLKYNMMWMICRRDIPKMLQNIKHFCYSAEEVEYALYHASIFHYAGHDMWSYDGITPIPARLFEKYRRLCDWRDEKRRFRSPGQFILWCLFNAKRWLMGDWKDAMEHITL